MTTHTQVLVDDCQRDPDPEELAEWREAVQSIVTHAGPARARETLDAIADLTRGPGIAWQPPRGTPYVNSIAVAQQAAYPGDLALEQRLAAIMRWNAMAMVVRANRKHGDLGGHISTYASAADLFEVGFNHCFRGATRHCRGDLVFFQPHSAPGVYARAFVEGRLDENDLAHYRQEVTARCTDARGLSSYPHP